MITIFSPTGRPLPVASPDEFRRLVLLRWDDAAFLGSPTRGSTDDLQADVWGSDGQGFRLYHAADGQSISTDHAEYRFEVAEWACSWMGVDDDFIMLDINRDRVVRLATGARVADLKGMEEAPDWDQLTL